MRQQPYTWTELLEFCAELSELRTQDLSSSRVYITLNELHRNVELYLEEKGYRADATGAWPKKHPTHKLLKQLAESIEACKEAGPALNDRLLCFVEDILLPELARQWETASPLRAS